MNRLLGIGGLGDWGRIEAVFLSMRDIWFDQAFVHISRSDFENKFYAVFTLHWPTCAATTILLLWEVREGFDSFYSALVKCRSLRDELGAGTTLECSSTFLAGTNTAVDPVPSTWFTLRHLYSRLHRVLVHVHETTLQVSSAVWVWCSELSQWRHQWY